MKILNKSDCHSVAISTPTTDQQLFKYYMLVSAVVQFTSDDCDANVEDEILKEAVGQFDHYALIEHSLEEGVSMTKENGWKPERFQSVEVVAEIWEKLEVSLPFDPKGKLSLSEQHCIHTQIADFLQDSIDPDYLPQVSEVELWLMNESGEPILYLTGLLDVLEGNLSQRKLKRVTEEARLSIPLDLLASTQAV